MPYQEQQFNLPTLAGLSPKQIEVHLKLYAGYVNNSNALLEKHALSPSEFARRFAFEFNGMRLHELYFEALGGNGAIQGALADALAEQWGSLENWLTEFKAIGMMRGIGWVVLTFDAKARLFHNVWIGDHELGHLAGLPILLAMDVWEHAFLLDYLPAQRPEYINVFFQNLRWDVCDARYVSAK